MKIARGTVRAGSRTSPLGASAVSMPRNAKISTIDARPTLAAAGAPLHARFSRRTAANPTTMSSSNGSSFATIISALKRLAPRTPATFSAPSAARIATSAIVLADPVPSAGIAAASASAKNDETAAVATVMPAHSVAPVMNPTNGPKATSTYAYNPPVSETLLPASAKHMTINPIATAQTTYATGAAAPSAPAAAEGRRKIPPPIVTLTMPADRPQTP